jgi:hypothetical protein
MQTGSNQGYESMNYDDHKELGRMMRMTPTERELERKALADNSWWRVWLFGLACCGFALIILIIAWAQNI